MNKASVRYFLSLICFLLSASVLYNPLYNTTKPVLVLVISVLLGFVINFVYQYIFFGREKNEKNKSVAVKTLCIFSASFLCASCVFYLDKIKEAFSFFSDFYGTEALGVLFTMLMLLVCAYAGHKNSDGVYRLCQFLGPAFIAFYVVLFMSLFNVKSLVLPTQRGVFGISPEGIVSGVFSAVYFFCDIAVFNYVFEYDNNNILKACAKKQSYCAVFFFLLIMLLNRIRTSFVFGEALTRGILYCDVASIKLLPVLSLPEVFLLFNVLACIVKVSVYLCAAAKLVRRLFNKENNIFARFDTYFVAIFVFLLTMSFQKVFSMFSQKDTFFTLSVVLSSFFMVVVVILLTKHQNKTN